MQSCLYESPLGGILISADDDGIAGMRFEDDGKGNGRAAEGSGGSSSLSDARRWLDEYFGGKEPAWTPALHIEGSDFEKAVWSILLRIPYGRTRTYGDIARELEASLGRSMSAQAVGGAVGRNPICIIVPCHRVVGADGNLTGYAGGLDRKVALLKLEKADMTLFHLPKDRKGKAL
ncbi:MAG: methylated-DNA--[protein]-cysteine S-methyltransferase [Succinivibrio sp.]